MFHNSKDAINWIESVKKFGDKLDLTRMELACTILGHPEKELNVIHVAGTNGKGSTVSFLKHILLEQGYNVGTFTSPYIVSFNERITHNFNNISDEELLIYINKVYSLSCEVYNQFNEVITFFELITLISFLYFRDKNLDYVIYEVGLGGKLDATNVVAPIITAITSISYDHMGVLGNTITDIALNKLGIVKPNIPLVTAIDQDELKDIFETYATRQHSKLTFIDDNDLSDITYGKTTKFVYKTKPYEIAMLGNHQVKNASLAIEIIKQLKLLKLVIVDEINLVNGLRKTYWPGRMETFGNIVIDGAHNIGGAIALKDSMKTLYKDKYIKVLFTSMADKEYFDIIRVLETYANEIHFTEFSYPRCETAENLYNVSAFKNKYLEKDALKALRELRILKQNEVLLITGSLYFISYIRKEI
jgi:dihydrofolate synthase/folylpolyglutamate synthase